MSRSTSIWKNVLLLKREVKKQRSRKARRKMTRRGRKRRLKR